MGKSALIKQNVQRELSSANYLLTKTYPLVKEEKIFLEVLRHLWEASQDLLKFTVHYTQEKSLITRVPKTRTEKLMLLNTWASGTKNLYFSNDYMRTLKKLYWQLKEVQESQENNIMNFRKGNNYVICKKDYKVEVISYSLLNNLLKESYKLYAFIQRLS